MVRYASLGLLVATLLFTGGAMAHHSRAAFYDTTRQVQVEGVITRVLWRHPHVRYWVQADAASGGALWELETTPPSILEREGIDKELLKEGTRVRAAGPPARNVENAMEVSHVLLPDGREVHLYANLETLWSEQTIERALQPFSEEVVAAATAAANGIYRVWIKEGGVNNSPRFWLDSYPLTDSARQAAAAWDVLKESDTGCSPKGMPNIMNNIWPFEFVDEGTAIRLRIEEFDQERLIHMQAATAPDELLPLGFSTGRWEGNTLIVHTDHIVPAYFGTAGITLGPDAVVEERFTLSADEQRLDYTMTVNDPATFTSPITQSSWWTWRPGEAVKPYDCVEVPESWTSLQQ